MQVYITPFTFDFATSLIEVDVGANSVDCVELYTACKSAQASSTGIIYDPIAKASGLNSLGDGVQVGITVELLGNWQIHFPSGNYIAKISGGNLIGGPSGDPVAYSSGVQTLLLQSAASTVVTTSIGGTVPTAEQNAAAVWSNLVDGGLTAQEAMKVLVALSAGKTSGFNGGAATVTFRDQADSQNVISAAIDANGNRTSVTIDAS